MTSYMYMYILREQWRFPESCIQWASTWTEANCSEWRWRGQSAACWWRAIEPTTTAAAAAAATRRCLSPWSQMWWLRWSHPWHSIQVPGVPWLRPLLWVWGQGRTCGPQHGEHHRSLLLQPVGVQQSMATRLWRTPLQWMVGPAWPSWIWSSWIWTPWIWTPPWSSAPLGGSLGIWWWRSPSLFQGRLSWTRQVWRRSLLERWCWKGSWADCQHIWANGDRCW